MELVEEKKAEVTLGFKLLPFTYAFGFCVACGIIYYGTTIAETCPEWKTWYLVLGVTYICTQAIALLFLYELVSIATKDDRFDDMMKTAVYQEQGRTAEAGAAVEHMQQSIQNDADLKSEGAAAAGTCCCYCGTFVFSIAWWIHGAMLHSKQDMHKSCAEPKGHFVHLLVFFVVFGLVYQFITSVLKPAPRALPGQPGYGAV